MEPTIVICTNENKKKILRENSKKHLFQNLKFYTFQELKKNLFFDYDNQAISFVMNYLHVSIQVAKVYLDNLYFLKDINQEKVQFLLKLKKELDERGLLIYHDSFVSYLKGKKIIVYGYPFLSKVEELILAKMDAEIEYQMEEQIQYVPSLYEADTIDQEVEFVVSLIAKLLLDGKSISNIKLIASVDYENILTRYFHLFHIPFNKKGKHSLYSTFVAQEFLTHYDACSIEENILTLSEHYPVNDLITVLNRSVLIEDKDLRKEFIIFDLKNTYLEEDRYEGAVSLNSLNDVFDDDDYVFLLGFNVNDYPKIKRDIDYLSDDIKERLGLDTTSLENNLEKQQIISQIRKIKHLIITYKLKDSTGVRYPSVLIQELGLKVEKIVLDPSISYSEEFSDLKYAMCLDNLYKFNILSDDLAMYQNSLTIPYLEYDNEFTGVNNKSLLDSMNRTLTLSYTNLEMYQECAFKYYVSKVLHLDIFEETFKTIIGSIMHHILEVGLIKEIDIPVEMMQFIKDKGYQLNAKELFYLEELSLELQKILDVILRQQKNSQLDQYLFENEFFVYKDQNDLKVTFKGLIDKVMYKEVNGKEIIAVVDYKTGNTIITLNHLLYGLHIQLPIYLYLLKKSDRFKNAYIAGFYIQKILAPKSNIELNKTEQEVLEESLRLQGFTNRDEYLMGMIDQDYLDSRIIQNLKFKKDGEISSRAKVLSNEEMDDIIKQVDFIIDQVITQVLSGKFLINPKVIDGKNIACTYCKFRDLCFKRKKNEVILGGDYNGLDEGTGASN